MGKDKIYFISSDIHSFFDEWMKSLDKKGFDITNPSHIIVVLGDIFDRGEEPYKVYKFLRGLPKERRILIRGNHEILLKDLVHRREIDKVDIHNGTWNTMLYLNNEVSDEEFKYDLYLEYYTKPAPDMFTKDENGKSVLSKEYQDFRNNIDKEVNDKISRRSNRVFNNPLIKEILEWIDSDEWINYWETPNYIFVHSWIPLREFYILKWGIPYKTQEDEYREDWRNATQTEWEDAMWGCPWHNAQKKLNKTGKTIVCGHWHTSDMFNNLTNTKTKKKMEENPIFKSKRYQLIGLDACTVVSGYVNCLVLKEEEL